MLLSVSHIHKAYGETVILPDVSFTMERGDHFALVGRNGSGKSTLLNIIVGDLRADEGVVSLEKDATVGYLPQYLDMVMEGSLYDFVLHAREDILEDEKKMASMEDAMKTASGDELNRLLEDYQSFSHIFEMKGGTSYRSQVEGALFGLGLYPVRRSEDKALPGPDSHGFPGPSDSRRAYQPSGLKEHRVAGRLSFFL